MTVDLAWTALEWPGMEHVLLTTGPDGVRADSQLTLAEDGIARVSYELTCDASWQVRVLMITTTSAAVVSTLTLACDGRGSWLANGKPAPELSGCTELDISCTPLTNTLPIRRLSWSPDPVHDIDVAYVPVPSLDVRRVRQRYTLLSQDRARDEAVFRYESGTFRADLTVDRDGIVVDYPGLWRRVGSHSVAA